MNVNKIENLAYKNNKKSVLVIVQARYSSSRLPGKILLDLDGKPLLQHTIERVLKASNVDNLVVATSLNSYDDAVELLCKKMKVNCFRGSEDDVLLRFIDAVKEYPCDMIVRICADEPLLDSMLLEKSIMRHISVGAEYSTSIGTVPKGLDIEIVNCNVLNKVDKLAKDKIYREHVTNYIVEHQNKFKFNRFNFGPQFVRPDIVLTVDTLDDFTFVKKMYYELKKNEKLYSNDLMNDIIKLMDSGKVQRKKIILMRADGSREKGMGDLNSLVNISEQLKDKYEIIFVSRNYPEAIDFLKKKGYEVFSLSLELDDEKEIEYIRNYSSNRKINYCIAELFPQNINYVEQLSKFMNVLMVDFFGNVNVSADILLCWDLDAKEKIFHYTNKKTLKLLGSDFIPINYNFTKLRKKTISKELKKITISFGGSDPNDLTILILEALINNLSNTTMFEITVILGPAFKKVDKINELIRNNIKNIHIIHSPNNIQQLFANSDLIISNGGLTAFELCALGVPFIGVSSFDWEIKRLKMLALRGVCVFLNVNSELKINIIHEINDLQKVYIRNQMHKLSLELIDGKGSKRIADNIKKRWV